MSNYTQEQGKEFWFDFDNQTLWQRTDAVTNAMVAAYFSQSLNLDLLYDEWRISFLRKNYSPTFEERIRDGAAGFVEMASIQLEIIDSHFNLDEENIRSAFEDFGQGVLYDPRPPRRPTRYIHMMDGTPDTWVGYHRWYAFNKAAVLFGADEARLLSISRYITLAWCIQTELNPALDSQVNQPMDDERKVRFKDHILNSEWEELDRLFISFPKRAPSLGDLIQIESGRFKRVQHILEEATGTASPVHSGKGRFWNMDLDEFKSLTIYGINVIEENDGSNSGLVKALKGEPPFGEGGMPRMPMNLPPVSNENVAFIENWINEGCPEI